MKKKISLLIILIAITISSVAYAWSADARVSVQPLEVNGVVWNQLPSPIICTGKVYGRVRSGYVGWSKFYAIIPPGMNAYAYVFTNSNDPFVRGWANIQCKRL